MTAPDGAVIVIKPFDPLPFVPDEPDKVEVVEGLKEPVRVAAPTINDTPRELTAVDFPQPMQPPRPDLPRVDGMLHIPENRSGGLGASLPAFNPDDLEQQPVARVRIAPVYPFEMKRSETSGEVIVDFIVDATGHVQNAVAVRSSHREFEPSAVEAVRKWRFRPGIKGGRAVNTRMQVPIVFSIEAAN